MMHGLACACPTRMVQRRVGPEERLIFGTLGEDVRAGVGGADASVQKQMCREGRRLEAVGCCCCRSLVLLSAGVLAWRGRETAVPSTQIQPSAL